MKNKIFLMLTVVAMLTLAFAVSVGAATLYQTEEGVTLFSYTDENKDFDFDTYEGSFPKVDGEGNELTWYIISTRTEGDSKIYTVASLKTLGEAGKINENGAYSYISPVTNKNTVSVNFPDNAGIKTIPSFGAYATRAQNNIIFAYLPNTLTEIGESLFQETPVIVAEFDDETPITFYPHKVFHEARNIETVNIPASVEIIDSIDDRMGAPFCNTLSLKTVTFAPGSKLTRIYPFAFIYSGIEEIQFPDSMVAVNQNLFRACKNLKVVRFGEGFRYFENVDRNNNVSDVHHSLTHTATGIKEVYLSPDFYSVKPDVKYRVSYAFDGCNNAKFFFTGTKAQLDTAIANFTNAEWTTGATDHNYILSAYNSKKIVTYSEYEKNPEAYAGLYIITDYNTCDAFYKGEHNEDNNPCVINCDRCKAYGVAEKSPVHNISTTVVYVSFDSLGTKRVGCVNEGCTHGTDEDVPAIFGCMGYSVSEGGKGGIVIGFTVNYGAIAEYEKITGKTLRYGVFAVSQSKLGDNEIFDENGNASSGVVNAEIFNREFAAFELKIVGFANDQKDISLALGAYVTVTDGEDVEYSYIQSGEPLENDKYCFVSYNDILSTTR